MDYRQAEAYILSFTDYEKTPAFSYTAANYDLRRVESLLQPLGNPHLGTRTIHIAGTKGKGSTAAMIAQILVAAGYKAGLYTSPHLITLTERIRINNTLISETEFASIITEIQPLIEVVNGEATYGKLTTFEILTAAALAYFKKNQVAFQVLEVGLGGRLDATNVAVGDVCVITSISLDHTLILGNTLAKIAEEKAGIIKPGCIVINFPQTQEAQEVIERVCHEQGSRLIQVGKDITWHRTSGDLHHQLFVVNSGDTEYELTIPLIGDYQLENATAAVAAIEVIVRLGSNVQVEAIRQGLNQVNWPGRLQILQECPVVVIDGAHNVYSLQKLLENVKKYFNYSKCFLILGISSDKDIAGMAHELALFTPYITVTHSAHPRAATASILMAEFSKQGIEAQSASNVTEAISQTVSAAKKTDLILITGSLFVVAEALSYYSD
jgi:dihydrofolate synthase/folylpolyglutamate synthase